MTNLNNFGEIFQVAQSVTGKSDSEVALKQIEKPKVFSTLTSILNYH